MNATECAQCPVGLSQSDKGQTSCIKCSPGEFNDVVGAVRCKLCLNTTYFGGKGRNSSCVDCPIGWSSEDGSAKCTACGAGTFSNVTREGCKDCPVGRWQNESGQTKCKDKQEGKVIGSSKTFQITVPLGSRICNTKDCTTEFIACKAGTKGTNPATTECIDCLPGKTSYNGSIACFLCGKGKYASEKKSETCKECEENTYSDDENTNKTRCQTCPTGYETLVPGAGACSKKTGLVQAEDCKDTEYLNNTAMALSFCVPCPEGKFLSSVGG